MKIKIIYILLLNLLLNSAAYTQEYAIAKAFCPVLNTSEFEKVFGGTDGASIKLSDQKFIEELEFIAYPGSVFEIKKEIKSQDCSIFEVVTNEYPYNKSKLYIDSRFTDVYSIMPFERKPEPFTKEQIIEHLNKLEGTPYLWGGNLSSGTDEMLEYYKPAAEIDAGLKSIWKLEGVDCSGLLYEATGGATPRNTSSLIFWGEPVEIEGRDKESILEIIKPLDLIAWDGHVLIVVNCGYVIESSPIIGVNKTRLDSKLEKIIQERRPVNFWDKSEGERFVIKRWIQ